MGSLGGMKSGGIDTSIAMLSSVGWGGSKGGRGYAGESPRSILFSLIFLARGKWDFLIRK